MIGTVYKIEIGENIYIGSTIQTLKERQVNHNNRLNKNVRTNKLYEECRVNNIEKIVCIPLEVKEIEDELEIRELENKYIDELKPSLNHKSAPCGLPILEQRKQYREKNKDKIRQLKKEYRENNVEKIREKKKEYRENNVEKIREKKKRDWIKNREKTLEKWKEKITCPICGFLGLKINMHRHQRTKKCLAVRVREI